MIRSSGQASVELPGHVPAAVAVLNTGSVDYPTRVNQLHRTLEIVDMFLVVVIATDTYVEIVTERFCGLQQFRCGLPGQVAFYEVMDGSAGWTAPPV